MTRPAAGCTRGGREGQESAVSLAESTRTRLSRGPPLFARQQPHIRNLGARVRWCRWRRRAGVHLGAAVGRRRRCPVVGSRREEPNQAVPAPSRARPAVCSGLQGRAMLCGGPAQPHQRCQPPSAATPPAAGSGAPDAPRPHIRHDNAGLVGVNRVDVLVFQRHVWIARERHNEAQGGSVATKCGGTGWAVVDLQGRWGQ